MNTLTDTPAIDDTLSINELSEENDPKVDGAESQDSKPALDINFLALDGSPIAKMGVAVRWQGGELLARTDADGAIPPVEAPSGKILSIAVQRFDGSYKKIGECCMPSSDGILTGVSPNIVLETTTEKHEGKPGCAEERIPKPEQGDLGDLSAASSTQASAIDSPPPASGPETAEPASTTATPSTQTTKTETPAPKPSAKPKAPTKVNEPKTKQHADKPPQHISGREEAKPKLEKGRDENGNPLAVVTQKARDWWNSWRMPTLNLWGGGATNTATDGTTAGGTTPATPVAINIKMVEQVKGLLEFAKEQTQYEFKEGTAAVLKSMSNGTFNHPKGEKLESKAKGWCYTHVKVAFTHNGIVNGIIAAEKTSSTQSAKDFLAMQESASKAGPALLAKGFTDVTDSIPDPRWAAAGDVIVYAWSEQTWGERKKAKGKEDYPNHGHIDIRDYETYISDFMPDSIHPRWFMEAQKDKNGNYPPTGKFYPNYVNIRIYRKVYDPLPTLRIKAFLRCLREFECQAEGDDGKRYQMLNTALPDTNSKKLSSYATHPWATVPDDRRSKHTAAGAYQINFTTWKEVLDKGLIELKQGGDRFTPAIQDRIAVIKIEDRKALHLIRTGKIAEAINGTSLRSEWTSLPGGGENSNRKTADGKPMNMAYLQSLFDKYLAQEMRKASI
jgi:muramidase (phage lysozyme)